MKSLSLALSAVVSLSACGSQQVEPAPAPVPEPAPRPVERPRPEPPQPLGWQVGLAEIGWEVVPPEPPDRAFKANTQGWQRHQKSDWAGSRPFFQEAVSIVTEYDLARYNLACAHSRLGDLDAALEEITHVLVRDLPRFKRFVHEDQDLGNLRRSPLNDELESRLEKIEKVWEQAMITGTPAVAWRERSQTMISEAQGKQGQLLRPGVWVHKTERFVPAMEIVDDAFSGFVDVEKQKGILIVASPTVDVPPLLEGARVLITPLSPAGESPRKAELVQDNLGIVETAATDSGVRIRLNTTKTAWKDLRAGGLVRSEDQHLPDRPVLKVTPDGSLLIGYHPDGWSNKNRSVFMPGGREIQMQAGQSKGTQHSIFLSGDGVNGVVVAIRMKCTDEGPVLHHWIDRIDLNAGTAEGLANADGAAAAQYGRDGALYLQLGTETIRYPTPTATTYETLPEGVMLVPPMKVPTCQ